MVATELPLALRLAVPAELDDEADKAIQRATEVLARHYDPVAQVVVLPKGTPPEIRSSSTQCPVCSCTFGCLDDQTVQVNDD